MRVWSLMFCSFFIIVNTGLAQIVNPSPQKLPAFFRQSEVMSGKQDTFGAVLQSPNAAVHFDSTGLTFTLPKEVETPNLGVLHRLRTDLSKKAGQGSFVSLSFANSQATKRNVSPHFREPLRMRVNYFKGPPSEWQSNMTVYKTLVYEQVWQGIDLVYNAQRDINLLPQIHVKQNADLSQVVLNLGVDQLAKDEQGQVIMQIGEMRIVLPKVTGESSDGRRFDVDYKLLGANRLGFEVVGKARLGDFVIAPELVWSSLLGTLGNNFFTTRLTDIAVDSQGQAFVVGDTPSVDFQTTDGVVGSDFHGGHNDAFIAKLNDDASDVIFATFLGGNDIDYLESAVVDSNGDLFIAGETRSGDFPVSAGAVGETRPLANNVFVAKLHGTTGALLFSSLLGGDGNDAATRIALDQNDQPVVVGYTNPINFTVTTDVYNQSGNQGIYIFLAKLNHLGTVLLTQTYFGGDWDDVAYGLALDDQDNIYISGFTLSPNFPVTGTSFGSPEFQFNTNAEAFALKLNATATQLEWSTTLRGNGQDLPLDMALDNDQNVYLSGYTTSSDLQVTEGAFDTQFGSGEDGFVLKLAPDGESVLFGTYFGGVGIDRLREIELNADGDMLVAGQVNDSSVQVGSGYSFGDPTSNRAVISQIAADGTTLDFTIEIDSSNRTDSFTALTLDSSGNLYAGGEFGYDSPTSVDAYNPVASSGRDPYVCKFNSTGDQLIYGTFLNAGGAVTEVAMDVDSANQVIIGMDLPSSVFPTTQGASFNGSSDVLLAKLLTDGSGLEWATYLGGSAADYIADLTLDANNDIYLTGRTYSSDFPVVGGISATGSGRESDFYVSKLSSDGSSLQYSAKIGGDDRDEPARIVVDGAGMAYVAGRTLSTDFPVTANVFDDTFDKLSSFDYDGFLLKLNATASNFDYVTLLGNIRSDEISALAVDSSGQAIVGGTTSNADFPTTQGAFATSFSESRSGFIAQFDAVAENLVFSTFIGWGVTDLLTDQNGDIYFLGEGVNQNYFVTAGTIQQNFCSAMLGHLRQDGGALNLGACMDHELDDSKLALDSQGNLVLAFDSFDAPFLTTNGSTPPAGETGRHGYVAVVNSSLSTVIYSSYLAGSDEEIIDAVAVDANGDLYVAGTTESSDFPTTTGAYREELVGTVDAFVSKLEMPDCVTPILGVFETNVSVCEGEPFTLAPTFLGSGTPEVVWYRNGLVIDGATSLTLEIQNPSTADDGVYVCEVTTGCGMTSSEAITLTIQPFEGFVSQPLDVVACEGAYVILTTELATSGGITFTWYRDGVLVSSGSGGSRISESFYLDANTAGTYTCRLTTDCGSVWSDPATVTMVAGTMTMEATPITQGLGLGTPFFDVELGCAEMQPEVSWQAFPETELTPEGNGVLLTGSSQQDIRLEVTVDYQNNNPVITKSVYYKHSESDQWRDFNGDGSNTAQDLYDLLQLWGQPFANDADGDGKITILDTFYLPNLQLE